MRHLHTWFSTTLQKEMPVAVYGHYGFALLLVPTAAADYLEYERFQLIHSLWPFIESGKVKVFSIDSINRESWMDPSVPPQQAIDRHRQWNQYIYEEVVPFVRSQTSPETPLIVSGASFGALHSANLFFQRPDLFDGIIAMSGVYNLMEYTKGFYNEDVYFNSPAHYVPNLNDESILHQIHQSKHIHIFSGSGSYEDPQASRDFANILYEKGICYELDIWGHEWKHDWETWRAMLPHYLSTRF